MMYFFVSLPQLYLPFHRTLSCFHFLLLLFLFLLLLISSIDPSLSCLTTSGKWACPGVWSHCSLSQQLPDVYSASANSGILCPALPACCNFVWLEFVQDSLLIQIYGTAYYYQSELDIYSIKCSCKLFSPLDIIVSCLYFI